MAQQTRDDVRNVAIIAHVDHGKTTLLDALLGQSEASAAGDTRPERARPGIDPEREKRVSIMPRLTSFNYHGTRFNVMDTPHSDLAGEVERTVRIVEGFLFVVDACEGPPPQIRFVLRAALEAGLSPIVVVNKIDREAARPAEVLAEVRELLVDLDASPRQMEFPVLYANAWRGSCRLDLDGAEQSLGLLLDEIVRTVSPPRFDPEGALQFLVTSLAYDDFLGRLALGRVIGGTARPGQVVVHCRPDGTEEPGTLAGVFGYEGLRRLEIDRARAGDIVELKCATPVRIGETLCDPQRRAPVGPVKVDEPTLTVVLGVNDSPMAGLEGPPTDARALRERLWRELLTNAAIRVEETESVEAFRLCGRSELQLAMLLEMMRREGHEMLVGKPEVVTRTEGGAVKEPAELLVVDCPEGFIGVVTEKLGRRRGRMTRMVNHGTGRVRMEFRIPARGLLGFRAEFVADTKGLGILHHGFAGWEPWCGEIGRRTTGSLVADRPGRVTAHAVEHLQHRGTLFVAPHEQVYEGMVVGENSRASDLAVDVTKERRPQTAPGAPPAPAVHLIPPRSMSLEQALEFLHEDEVVEVTPRALRIRKRALSGGARERRS